tara:strand:- start:3102 stop:3773 length:672 start_codon:yes stop_codon:yes gene_type:complete
VSRIINFDQAKIAHAFEQFNKDYAITDYILESIIPHFHFKSDIDDVLESYPDSDRKRYYNILIKIKEAVKTMTSDKNLEIRYSLEDEYFALLQKLETIDPKWKVPSILIKYRKNINPIRALKYEIQEIMAMYEVVEEYHVWIVKQFHNKEKINDIVFAIKNDMLKLKELQKKYLRAKEKYSYFVLPMSYYHCKEMEQDMLTWIKTFQEFLKWGSEDDIKNRYL